MLLRFNMASITGLSDFFIFSYLTGYEQLVNILSGFLFLILYLWTRDIGPGTFLEEVPDRSVFIEYFLKRLLDNEKKYISSGELYNSFRDAVLNNSPNIPQYGFIQDAGDEGGEFIFIKR